MQPHDTSRILVINAGSSSVKFSLFGMDAKTVCASGIVERIGLKDTMLHYQSMQGAVVQEEVVVNGIPEAVSLINSLLTDGQRGVITGIDEILALGHRVVHGGEKISGSVIVDDRVKSIIEECIELAPLHNPPNLEGIEVSASLIPGALHVAVFDTAFHSTIPEHAYLYGLPYSMYREHRIRRYGFHGISHKYVAHEAARFLEKPIEALKIITCHLGNGCSITAVQNGRSIDTSMGFTPLEGLIMGTRCGDIDPAIVTYLMEHKQMDHAEIVDILNRRSGLFGLAEIGSSDLRDIYSAKNQGNRQANMAIKVFCYRIKKYIGAYAAAMGGLDVLVFTAGIGENCPPVRSIVCEGWEQIDGLKVILNAARNETPPNGPMEIHDEQSRVKILVIPTNEEEEIAQQTMQILRHKKILPGVGAGTEPTPGSYRYSVKRPRL